MEYHEILMSEILETTTIKERFFSDFKGVIKSLGAWGGDFFLATYRDLETAKRYFQKKGYTTLFTYQELIK